MLGVIRWLLALYVLALGVPLLEAAVARAALADATLVELCTGDGVRRVALDRHGQPVEHVPTGHHAGYDCTACLTGCAHHGLCGGSPCCAFVLAWPSLEPAGRHGPAIVAAGPAAHAPLPARGPPTVS